MQNTNRYFLTDIELISSITSTMVAMGLFALPASAVELGKQDGWIAVLLGAIYPLLILIFGFPIVKLYPHTTIMELSKQFFGVLFGNLLNLLFMGLWLFYAVIITAGAMNMIIVFSGWFLTPLKILIVFALLIVWGSTKGLKILAKLDVIGFFLVFILLASAIVAFTKGSILNLQPVFHIDVQSLVKAGINTTFSYGNMELLLVIHPLVKNREKIIQCAAISAIVALVIYLWVVITALVYLGPDIVPKAFWPFYYVSEGVKIAVINNFRFIMMIFWPLVVYRTVATDYYAAARVMGSITGMKTKKWCILLLPAFILPLLFVNEFNRRDFVDKTIPWVTLFAILYVMLIGVITFVKGKDRSIRLATSEQAE